MITLLWLCGHWKEAFFPATWSNWALVIVGSAAAWAALKTLKAIEKQGRTMRRQTKALDGSVIAAEKGAEAALLNAQAVINAERAWLTVSLRKSKVNPGYIVSIKNRGNTPAKILRLDSKLDAFVPNDPENLVIPRDYEGCVEELPNTMFIVKGFTLRHGCLPEEIIDLKAKRMAVETGREFLMIFGRIVYDDVFPLAGGGTRVPHETCWCFAYDVHRKRFRMSGPSVYTRNT